MQRLKVHAFPGPVAFYHLPQSLPPPIMLLPFYKAFADCRGHGINKVEYFGRGHAGKSNVFYLCLYLIPIFFKIITGITIFAVPYWHGAF